MARNPGVLRISANFEPIIQAPLDARQKVGFYADLVNPATWLDPSGNTWIYQGALVVVANDPSAGVYWLNDIDYTDYANWQQAGGVVPFDPSAIYSYIDGSLAQRDSSITDLYSRISIIDSSISYLVLWNTSQDSSIQRIDSSINALFSRVNTIDSSISYLDSSIKQLFVRDASSIKGAINIGDGSVGIFKSVDISGNIQLKSFAGSGAAIVSESNDVVYISLDASFSGEVNYGQNIGIGDASIYKQKSGQALEFREIKGQGPILVSVSDNLVIIDASIAPAPSGAGIDGGVWITNITPSSGGNVGDKVYSSGGAVLDSCLTDTSSLTVAVLALPGHTNYRPYIYINDVSIIISASVDKPIFTGTYNIQYNFTDASITVVHEDGAHWSTIVNADTPAVIQSAVFIEGYPGVQTELKAGDTFDVSIMTDVPIVSVIVDDYGAFSGGTFAVSGNNVKITPTIANRGDFTQALGFRLRVVKSTGSTSPNYLSADHGIVDGTHLVNLNNRYPSLSFSTVGYPLGQGAIKSGEDASVSNTALYYDTITYSSPNGQLTVINPTTYETPKKVTYLSGGYNISTPNLSVTANRAANNATSTTTTTVWIANTPATLSVSNGATRFISGGNDGTSPQNHIITINANGQRLLSAPTLAKGSGGTWVGGFSWTASATTFTATLQVHDNETKGGSTWGAISGTNLAGIVTSTNSGATTYTLGGFAQRDVSLAAFGIPPAVINVEVSDYSKVPTTLNWYNGGKQLPNKRSVGTTAPPADPDSWAINALNVNPTTINILDTATLSSISAPSTIRISESA